MVDSDSGGGNSGSFGTMYDNDYHYLDRSTYPQ